MVNNLAITGSHNSEFDSLEALNNMKLLATSYGYEGVGSVERVQTSADGSTSLFFSLENTPGTTYGANVLITLNKSPIFELFNLSELMTASYARAEPAPLYIDLSFDYSHSLAGGSISDLLKAFDVLDSSGTAPGPNGEMDGNDIIPTKQVQTLLPHSIDPWTGIILPWSDKSSIWPNMRAVQSGCIQSEENICPNQNTVLLPHKEVLKLKSADVFLQYKKAAALLTGIFGGKSQFADVHVFGGRISDATYNLYTAMLAPLSTGQNTTGFTTLENTGVYTVSEFDEYRYASYTFSPPITLSGNVSSDYSYESPKDLLRDPISFAPNRPLQLFLDNTFSRKLLKYVTLQDQLGGTIYPAGYFYGILNPNIPELTQGTLLDDSFAFNPGVLTDGNPANAESEQFLNSAGFFLLGWSSQPIPILGYLAPAFVTDSNVPWYIKYPLEYNCHTGIPLDNAAPLSQSSHRLGQRLCLIHKACSGTNFNCDGTGSVSLSSIQDAYRINISGEFQRGSPGCEGNTVPRCFGTQLTSTGAVVLLNSPDNSNAPMCINGVARCHPNITLQPRCYDETTQTRITDTFPECCDNSSGSCNPDYTPYGTLPKTHTRLSSGDTDTIGENNGEPITRGRLLFPTTQPPNIQNNIFHFLSDLTTLQGGTWTHNAVAKASARCQAFKNHFKGLDPTCALIMTTDGMPTGIDSLGNEIESSDAMIQKLAIEIDNFSNPTTGLNGKVFTWHLGLKPSEYENLVVLLQQLDLAGELEDAMKEIFKDHILTGEAIPEKRFSDWDTSGIPGLPAAKNYNDNILPEHEQRATLKDNFVTTVSPTQTNTNLRYLSTSVSNADRNGLTVPPEFLQYIEQIAVKLKREIKFQK